MKTETLSVRLSKAERRALRERGRREGVSQSSLVRRALRAYGVMPEPRDGRTGYDVVKHLIGRRRGGSKDLSINPKYLEDYGR